VPVVARYLIHKRKVYCRLPRGGQKERREAFLSAPRNLVRMNPNEAHSLGSSVCVWVALQCQNERYSHGLYVGELEIVGRRSGVELEANETRERQLAPPNCFSIWLYAIFQHLMMTAVASTMTKRMAVMLRRVTLRMVR